MQTQRPMAKGVLMSLFTKNLNENNTPAINYKASEGWAEVRIIGLADLGEEENKFNPGKMQEKFSILFALNETIEFSDGTIKPKLHTEKFVASLFPKSNLVQKYLAPAGISIESLDELIGQTMKLKFKLSDCGKYINVANVDEAESPLAAVKDVYVPKWWIEDKDGAATNFGLMVENGVIETLMPKQDSTDGDIYK
jgi:hypothetical protein